MPGGSPAASTSSFSIGSVRRYISVLWMLAWPSHRDTLRMSPVASRVWTAQEWRLCLARDSRHYIECMTMSCNPASILVLSASERGDGDIVRTPSIGLERGEESNMRHVINHQVVLSQAPEGPLATWLDKFGGRGEQTGIHPFVDLSTDSAGSRFQPMARARRDRPELHQLRASSAVSAIPHGPSSGGCRSRGDRPVARTRIGLIPSSALSVETTQIYLEATLAMKERVDSPGQRRQSACQAGFQPGDRLLGFLSSL